MDSSYTSSNKKEVQATTLEAETYDDYNGYDDDASDDDEEAKSGGPRMRCILCTTAASWVCFCMCPQFVFAWLMF